MPDIKDSVGDGGTNNVHDVALVQAMLSVIKDAKNNTYLADYDGKPGPGTTNAIKKFQGDQNLLVKPGAAPAPGAAAAEKEGLVAKGSATLAKMVGALPGDFKDIRIIENTKTVYLPGDENDSKASQKEILGKADLQVAFRANVAKLVDLMFTNHKIVLWVTKSGWKRTFDEQQKIATGGTGATHAGPGESNHNFGRAVDIGFNKFTWLKAGQKAVDDWWLLVLTKNEKDPVGNAKAADLWKARDAIAVKGLGLFNSILPGDTDHLQSFDDHLPNDRALADLLNRVGQMKWEAEHKTPRRYNSDLGLGATMFTVGKATEIWAGKATVTKQMIAQAKNDAAMKAALAKGPAAVKAVVPVLEKDIKDADVQQMQKALKADFATAEAKWEQWKAVP